MATGVWSWSTTAASNSNADAGINWSEGQDPSTVNDSARAEMAGVAKYLLDTHGALTTTGAANTYSVTTNSTRAAYADGQGLSLVINASSTGASTLNVDSVGAKAIRKITSAGEAAIGTGDMIAAGHYIFNYDASANSAAGAWILLNPTAAAAASFLSNVVEDTTPQLGGNLDPNGNGIAFSGATVTDVTGSDTLLVSGTAGTSGNLAQWDANGDAVDSSIPAANVVVDGDIGSTVQAQGATLDTIEALSLAQGDLLYATAADTITRLAKGTALQHLQMNAGATAPEWVEPSSGSYTAIVTAASMTGTAYDLTLSTAYNEFFIEISGLASPADNTRYEGYFSDDAFSTVETANYIGYDADKIDFLQANSWDNTQVAVMHLYIKRYSLTKISWWSWWLEGGVAVWCNGSFDSGAAVNGIRLKPDSGTLIGSPIITAEGK